jgi:hypothetical protein
MSKNRGLIWVAPGNAIAVRARTPRCMTLRSSDSELRFAGVLPRRSTAYKIGSVIGATRAFIYCDLRVRE